MTREEVRRIFASAPFIAELGIKLESAGDGHCETTLATGSRHLQQDGFVHAGVQSTMADHTAGAAAGTLVRPGEIVLTAEFKINLLRPARGEALICRARVVKPGRRLMVVESDVYCVADAAETLVARLLGTMAVVPSQRK
jgi:uncharacterized protein (TIGR00369 family)